MVVILHEGKDDKKYIKRIFNHLEIENFTDDTFYEMNNKSNFYKETYVTYRTLKQKIENGKISKIVFILDADNARDNKVYGGKENTINKLIETIDKLDFKFEYEIFVVCDSESNEGYFETLLLSSVEKELKDCYQKFMDCTGFKGKEQTKTIMTKLHEITSPESPYSFDNKNFTEIKNLIKRNFK